MLAGPRWRFNGKLRDELLDRKNFYTFPEVHVLIDRWWSRRPGVEDPARLSIAYIVFTKRIVDERLDDVSS